MRRNNIAFKIISTILIFTFTYQQILFAADMSYGIPADNEENRSGFVSKDALQKAEARQEALIDKMNDYLEWRLSSGYYTNDDWNLKKKSGAGDSGAANGGGEASDTVTYTREASSGTDSTAPKMTLTTEAGDIIDYGETIERVTQKDGTIIEDITLSSDGNILNAIVRDPDGTVLAVEGGKAVSSLASDGTATHYDANGRIVSQVAPDGLVTSYTYLLDASGNVTKTTVTTPDEIIEYDKDMALLKTAKSDGAVIKYVGGVISEITGSDGLRYIFEKVENEQSVEVRMRKVVDKDGYTVTFDNSCNVSSVTSPSGTITAYSSSGKPLSTYNSAWGGVTYDDKGRYSSFEYGTSKLLFSYQEDKNGAIITTFVEDKNAGAVAKYNASNTLVSVRQNDSTVDEATLTALKSQVDTLQKELDAATSDCAAKQTKLNAAKTALDNAVKLKDTALKSYNAALTALANATQARQTAEARLPGEANSVVTSYVYSSGKISLTQ
ncbi:MAG: hypothetical protein PHV48_07640, partial [Candidatus Omnitrophica bacterium]|nr:hypothetical protein [Candidatus Omnitrophota bacterium]